jgi:hypothetical protein
MAESQDYHNQSQQYDTTENGINSFSNASHNSTVIDNSSESLEDSNNSITVSSNNPNPPLLSSKPINIADESLESLLMKFKERQISTSNRRSSNNKELEIMKNQLKKLKRETEELLKAQQSNISAIGRRI